MAKQDTGIVDIRGKQYQTVALRVQNFRTVHPDFSLVTAVVDRAPEYVVMRAEIHDAGGRVIATGHAEEYRTSSQINKTSALENAETSAIGRALAAFGMGGTEFATANEVMNAIHQQNNGEGHSQQGAVSPPQPEKPVRGLDGPYTSKAKLFAAFTAVQREVMGCGDDDMLTAYLATDDAKIVIQQCERDARHYLHGGGDAPDDFEPLYTRIKRMRDEFQLENA